MPVSKNSKSPKVDKLQAHIESLKGKHRLCHSLLYGMPFNEHEHFETKALKQEKLRLKDRIAVCERIYQQLLAQPLAA